MEKKLLTLCFAHTESHILLGKKKRGFGEGKWNGFGGKVENNETIETAAKREMLEECGVYAEIIEPRGVITFLFNNILDKELEVHVFQVRQWSGEPSETEEMMPVWFALNDIPYADMWADDAEWLPHFLEGKSIKARYVFSDDSKNASIIEKEFNVI